MKPKQMSTEARKVIDALIEISEDQEVATMHNVLVAESLCYSFYSKTIIGHIKRFYNPNSKQDPRDMMFYVKPILSINKGKRNKDTWPVEEILKEAPKYHLISNYVETDFNYDTLKSLKELFATYATDHIKNGINTSKEADVFSVPFLARVLESEQVERVRIAERRRMQRERQEASRKGVHSNNPAPKRSPIDVANLAMGWEETINTVELEKQLRGIGYIDD